MFSRWALVLQEMLTGAPVFQGESMYAASRAASSSSGSRRRRRRTGLPPASTTLDGGAGAIPAPGTGDHRRRAGAGPRRVVGAAAGSRWGVGAPQPGRDRVTAPALLARCSAAGPLRRSAPPRPAR
ncbi:MAG: hypothetical protein IPI49_23340 [Myxococcales bacterium]|nr:hypothetical protein [Myxococcales bacterium]